MNHHLVIIKKVYLDSVLQGQKTTECRLSRTRRPPFGAVRVGDTLWLKQSGGQILATAKVGRVEFLHPLTPTRLAALQAGYADSLRVGKGFFDSYRRARFATLIWLSRIRRVEPLPYEKRSRCAWVVLAGPPCETNPIGTPL